MAWYDNIDRRGYNNYDGAQEYNPNFGQSFAGVGRFDPRNLMRPANLTRDLGAATYTGPQEAPEITQPRVPQWISSPNRPSIPERTGILENFKNKLSTFTTPAMDFFKNIGGRMTPEKRAEVEAIQGSADKYGWGNLPGSGLQGNIWSGGSGGDKVFVRDPATGTLIVRDKNLQSWKGSKTIGDMVQKKEDWMQGQFEKYGDEWDDDEHRGLSTKLYNYAKKKGLIDQWKGATPVDTTVIGTGDKPGIGPTTIRPSHFAEQGGGGYQQAPINRPDPSFSAPSTTGHMGPGGVHYAYGGRAGYQDGELVEDEYMAEATPGGMMEENIEEVQGEPTREQLEAIAFEIFRLPLEELNEEQLNVVYQAAMEQEPSEEEVQFAAQEGPGQGIASLV